MSVPNIVTNIMVENQYVDRKVLVSWQLNSSTDNVLYYNIYRSENQYSGFILIASTNDALGNSYLDALPYSIDKSWFYRVTAVNADGESNINYTQSVTTSSDTSVFYQAPKDLDFKSNLIIWQYGETPSGSVNGTNNTFYVAGRIKPLSLSVYKKPLGYPGFLRMCSTDFRVITANSFIMTTTPTATLTLGESLVVDYIWW
jgi:hypothetical protein